jgi:hypothetical protein
MRRTLHTFPQRHRRRFFTAAATLTATGLLLFAIVERDETPTATMSLDRTDTHALTVDDTLSVRVTLSTQQAINALHGALTYSTSTLTLVSTSTEESFLRLWPREPFQRSAGTIAFEGGTPTDNGFTGTETIMTAQFRTRARGTATVELTEATIFAHDGSGTKLPVSRTGTLQLPVSAAIERTNTDQNEKNASSDTDNAANMTTNKGSTSTSAAMSDVRLSVLLHALFQSEYQAAADINGDGKNSLKDISIYFSRR